MAISLVVKRNKNEYVFPFRVTKRDMLTSAYEKSKKHRATRIYS